jgi:hypothetical protein
MSASRNSVFGSMAESNDSHRTNLHLSSSSTTCHTLASIIRSENPYSKPQQIKIHEPTIQPSPGNSPSGNQVESSTDQLESNRQVKDNFAWGDTISTKTNHLTRVYFHNINGLQAQNMQKWTDILHWLVDKSVDICGLAEICSNTTDKILKQTLHSTASTFFSRSTVLFSSNTNPTASAYQPGGCLLLSSETWKSRIIQRIDDKRKWGRYVGNIFKLKANHHILVLTAYRCVQKCSNSIGIRTTVRHQQMEIAKLGLSVTVRQLCLDDLTTEIQEARSQYGQDLHILLMIDANETRQATSKLEDFLLDNNLRDGLQHLHPDHPSPATHDRSSDRCIDFMFGTQRLLDSIKFAGYLPFYQGVLSDHRGIFMDLDLTSLSDEKIYLPPRRIIGTHENTSTIFKYQGHIWKHMIQHNIQQRLEKIQQSIGHENSTTLWDKLDKLDKQVTNIALDAETRCTPKHFHHRWSPILSTLSLYLRYWQIKQQGIKKRRDTAEVAATILNSMQDPHKTEVIKAVPLDSSITAAIKKIKR